MPAGEDVVNAIWVSVLLETAATDVPTLINITGIFFVEDTGLPMQRSVPRVTLSSHSPPKEPPSAGVKSSEP